MKAKIIALVVRVMVGFGKKLLAIISEEEEMAFKRIETRIAALVIQNIQEGRVAIESKVETSVNDLPKSYA